MVKPFAMVIEDNRDIALLFAETLNEAGYTTEIIRDGLAARRRLSEATPYLIVLDMSLPHVGGRELLEQIRADERLAKTTVIVASAEPQMAETVQDKADLVLIKPVGFVQLHDLARRLHPGLDA
jgi:two-component system OmpR family response regulator